MLKKIITAVRCGITFLGDLDYYITNGYRFRTAWELARNTIHN